MLDHAGLYVHFPWCVRKCPYCDFNSHPLPRGESQNGVDFAGYVDALQTDYHHQQRDERYATVFLGGGTPSLCPPDEIARLLESLATTPSVEVTMEVNPGTTEHSDLGAYRNAGVSRLSLGAQSFHDESLAALGRIHDSAETLVAFANARAGDFDDINLDIMWGLPRQTVAQAMADIEQAIALAPEHISWYQLTIEPKTEFARRTPLLPRDEILAEIEREGLAALAAAGYTRYEVSAHARVGRQSRHNVNYWQFGDYLGIGAGAHGKRSDPHLASIVRCRKPAQPRLYLKDPDATAHEAIATASLPVEFMMNALRLVDGVDFDAFERQTGLAWTVVEPNWESLRARELVRHDRCATTPLGLRYLDSVVAEFLPVR